MTTTTKEKVDRLYFRKKFLNKKYQFLRTVAESELEEIYPKLKYMKEDVRDEYADIVDLDLDFVVLPSVENPGEFDIMMVYNDKYNFTI